MGRRAVRTYLGAPDPRVVDPELWPLPDTPESRAGLATVLTLIFGDARGEGRVISDSRQLGDLAKVLADPSGGALRVLKATQDLEKAVDATSDPTEQFSRLLRRAVKDLQAAAELRPAVLDEGHAEAIENLTALAQSLAEPTERELA